MVATLDALARVLRTIARALLAPRAPRRRARCARCWPRASATARVVDRLLAARPRGASSTRRATRSSCPQPGSGRAWTAVERDGRRVAAIVHDAALDTSPELVQAAAAASSLAIDNERLKADLRARVEELRVSRARIVEAADDARRRIERDLHDGAQQQLVALALELRVLRSRVNGPEARSRSSTSSRERLAAALAELRELARGIHPAILTERGLAPADRGARRALAGPRRSRRARSTSASPRPIEAAAYFVVAEALTNVARYAHATSARVRACAATATTVVVLVADDGVGGADLERGQRAARPAGPPRRGRTARSRIDSPPGAGTRWQARIPWRR